MTKVERQVLQLIEADPMIQQKEIAKKLGISLSSVSVCISELTKKGCIAGRGFVLKSGSYVVVVGGINMDICGRSFSSLVAKDSNPGVVRTSPGGVGRNIANNLSFMGIDVRLLSAYGDDANGERIAASCSELGIDISHALKVPGGVTSSYVYLTNPQGEMALAVSDMEICEKINRVYLSKHITLLQNAQVIVADANIPTESLKYLAENCEVPLFVDPVSTAKVEKLRPILNKIHTLKPNKLEAEILTGINISGPTDAQRAANRLLNFGVRRVFISMGEDGVFAATTKESLWLDSIRANMVNTTGCGDAFMAALVWAYLEGTDLRGTALAGLAAGSIAIESEDTINPYMSAKALQERMRA